MITMADYFEQKQHFDVDRELIQNALDASQAVAIKALHGFARGLWQGELPVYVSMTTPLENGGWGHLMPLWFKPSERPVPFYTLENWALFSLVYADSFGEDAETVALIDKVFTIENIVRLVAGTNILLPFLPTTDGQGYFFRHGMLPYLISVLWMDEHIKNDMLKLHESGARNFIRRHDLAAREDVFEWLGQHEHSVFSRLERNNIVDDEAIDELLSQQLPGSLFESYQFMFGAINLGVTALVRAYQDKPLDEWETWFYQELSYPYRMPNFAEDAIRDLIQSTVVNV